MRYLVERGIEMGIRLRSGALKGEIVWRRPARATMHCMLRNPIYAGIYAYGRRQVDPSGKAPGTRAPGCAATPRTSGSPASKGRSRPISASSSTGRTWPGSPPTIPAPNPGAVRNGPALLPACCAAAAAPAG